MKYRETIYPYNFDFANETLLRHWHITRFLNELQSTELFALDFQEGQLTLQFNGIFNGLGFKRYHFERKNSELSQRTLRELSKGLTRFKKTNRSNQKIGIHFYINTLKNEDRNSEVVDIITKLTGLITSLKTTGVQYLENRNESIPLCDCYVSPLLLSYWIERWDKFNGSTFDEGFWESVTYNGDVRSLEAKIIDIREYWMRNVSLSGLRVYFPQQRYVLIQDVTESVDIQLRFTNYSVEYFPSEDLFSTQSLQSYVNGRRLSLIHIIPHYLIYHVHNFETSEDLTHYLEWSIFRAQNELALYTSSVCYNNGLRFTRGCIISSSLSRYQHFLNLVLWNTVHFHFPSSSNDYLQWKSILVHNFNQFERSFKDYQYLIDCYYPAPKLQRDYIKIQLQKLTTINERSERLMNILRNYLDITYDADFDQPKIQKLGRIEYGIQKSLPTIFSEFPKGGEFKSNLLPLLCFIQTRILRDEFKMQKVTMRRNLLGVITVPIYATHKVPARAKEVLKNVADIRISEPLRTLAKRVAPFDLKKMFPSIANLLLQDTEIMLSFWLAILLHFASGIATIESIASANDDDPCTYGLECMIKKTVLGPPPLIINSSTPKLFSVFDSIFHYWSGVNSERVPVKLPFIKKILSNVLILGSVGDGDPFGEILQQYFHSSVTQVGAFGTGKVIRAEVSHFEFNVSYTAVISDIDIGNVLTKDELDDFLSNILIKYMRNIEPKLGVFKINYASTIMMQYILNYLHKEFLYFYEYTITFITPQFGKIGNYEKYLVFMKYDNTPKKGSFLVIENTETTLVKNFRMLESEEHQCENFDDFTHLSKIDFPRIYFFVTSRTSEIQDVLTVLSHRSDRIITSKSFGSDSVSYYATLSPSRVRLCWRVPKLFQMTSQLSERFSVEQFANSSYTFERENRVLTLGNFYRELCRIQMLMDDQGEDVLHSLLSFTSIENNYHYVGIGDERARNIICVPPMSPYTIYDKKSYPQLQVFNVTCINQYFPFENEESVEAIINLEFERHQRKLVFFFMFMLFNNALTADLILARIKTLANMFSKHRDKIKCVYFNTYLEFFGLPSKKDIVVDQPYTIYNDITISAQHNERDIDLYGTFSKNYDLVQLLKYEDIQSIADDAKISLINLSLHMNHIYFTLWNLGLSPSAFDANGITIASEFCPVLKFE